MTVATPTHHPSADMLLGYSAGSILPSHALCVATHLEYCIHCRTAHQRNNAIGGKLIEELPETGVGTELKDRVLGLLDQRRSEEESGESPEQDHPRPVGVPRVLHSLVPNGFQKLKWRIISTTARSCFLMDDEAGPQVSLLKLKPGGQVARHGHLGDEYSVVLSGSFSDEDGLYKVGDFLLRDAHEQHSPVATRDAECICLTVQDAPLQFTGWFFRLLNPLLRKSRIGPG